ncbi:MAG: hypothetical protein NVV83_09925 [Afipia sp.]|nr:hypothetical protein [Afipia sp.]
MREQIAELVRRGELFCLESALFGEETPRSIFVSLEVKDALSQPFPKGQEVLHSEFRQTLDAFLEHGEMTIGNDPRVKASDALMARVDPLEDEFFDFRITSPRPQIRAFGGFAELNVFVLITWNYRDAIKRDFDGEVARCKREWQRLFGSTMPFKGRKLDDYLTNFLSV